MYEKDVIEQLSILEPTDADMPLPASQALAQVQARLRKEQRMSWRYKISKKMSSAQGRLQLGSAFAALLLIVAFTFPGVRVAASELLSLFRVENLTAISISPEQLAILEQVAETGVTPGDITFSEGMGNVTHAASLDEAQAAAGLGTLHTIPRLGGPNDIYVVAGGEAQLEIDLEGTRGILQAVNADPMLLPDSLEGALVDAAVPAGVEQVWYDTVRFHQSPSPLVEYPDGLDAVLLGEALLRVLGLSQDEAQRLAQEIDWTTTLLLPIPSDFATFSEVTINGSSAIAINSLDGSGSALVWQDDGMMFMLTGEELSVEELLSFAGSVR